MSEGLVQIAVKVVLRGTMEDGVGKTCSCNITLCDTVLGCSEAAWGKWLYELGAGLKGTRLLKKLLMQLYTLLIFENEMKKDN